MCQVDILFINEDDYKRTYDIVSKACVPITVVTKNGGGCSINSSIDIPTIQTPVVDTTGAGDAFDAGFLHAWLSGASLEHCGRYAVACSYFNIRAFGSREGFTSRTDIDKLVKEAY